MIVFTFVLLLASLSPVSAATIDNSEQVPLSLESLQKIFPEANLNPEDINRIEENYKKGLEVDVLNKDEKPIKTYKKRINKNIHYLDVFEDGSYATYGSVYIEPEGIVPRSYITGAYDSYWGMSIISIGNSMKYRTTFYTDTTYDCSHITSVTHVRYVNMAPRSLRIVRANQTSSLSAKSLGKAELIDELGNLMDQGIILNTYINSHHASTTWSHYY